jgi:hypothetical protein
VNEQAKQRRAARMIRDLRSGLSGRTPQRSKAGTGLINAAGPSTVQLQETSFFVDPALIESLLDEEARQKQRS